MPAMKGKLGETEVVQLVSLVRNFRHGRQVVRDEPEDDEDPSQATEPKNVTSLPSARRTRSSISLAGNKRIRESPETGRGHLPPILRRLPRRRWSWKRSARQMPWIPDFASPVWQQRRSDPERTTTILEGKGTAMPTFRGKLNEGQLRDLLAHLRMFAPNAHLGDKRAPDRFQAAISAVEKRDGRSQTAIPRSFDQPPRLCEDDVAVVLARSTLSRQLQRRSCTRCGVTS